MRRTTLVRGALLGLVATGLIVGLTMDPATSSPEGRRGSFDAATTVEVTDRQGVTTEVTGFRRIFGSQLLTGRYGDAEVEVPFDQVLEFSTREMADRKLRVDVRLVDGERMSITLPASAFGTDFGGNASFGFYRISLGHIAKCEFLDNSRHEEGGQRCPEGHLFFTPSWRYCPYDGNELEKIEPEGLEAGSTEVSDD